MIPKTIEEKRDPIVEILEAVYLHGRLTPEQSYGLPEGQMTIAEATKAIVEIVEEERSKKKEHCNNTNNDEWMYCGVCEGRIHNPECTTKKVKGRDCFQDHTDEEYKQAGY